VADRFYSCDPLAPGEYVLTGGEAHHLISVRRFDPGDRIVLFNGDGHEALCEIVSADRKSAVLNVLSIDEVSREPRHPIHVASAMPKGDRGEFLIEKLVELGVARFTPLRTQRTIVLPKETRIDKLQQVVIEASKQCGRNRLMQIDDLTPWPEFLKGSHGGLRMILHPDGVPLGTEPPGLGVVIAVGPEGGFTSEEIESAQTCGWLRLSLGPRVLRVETAAIAAACLAGQM
jgi:16S rRNA (uracil1498-N3)-methyltransferase